MPSRTTSPTSTPTATSATWPCTRPSPSSSCGASATTASPSTPSARPTSRPWWARSAPASRATRVFTEYEQGALKQTQNDFDLALDGEGFFAIQTPYGERYSRSGAFVLGKEGFLETKEGYPVLGESGPIQVKANNFKVDKRRQRLRQHGLPGRPLPPRRARGERLGLHPQARHDQDSRFPEGPLPRQAGRRASGGLPRSRARPRSWPRGAAPRSPRATSRRATSTPSSRWCG